MFSSNMLVAALVAALAAFFTGVYAGYDYCHTKAEAQRMQDLADYNTSLQEQITLGNTLADKLAKAEGRITVKTMEVIKYVPQVTTGNPCLNTATVGLLQPGANPGIRPPSSELTPEGAAPASSDTDIAYWIAEANQHYETCAVRLNTLIDYENSRP